MADRTELESLYFVVDPAILDQWLEFERTEWLPWLRRQPGFMRKETVTQNGLTVNRIWWRSKEDRMKAGAKKNEIRALELRQRARFGTRAFTVKSN